MLDMQRQTLHELSGLNREEASRRLLEMLDTELTHEAGAVVLRHQKKMEETCEQKSREILLTALQRYAASHTAEATTSTVPGGSAKITTTFCSGWSVAFE